MTMITMQNKISQHPNLIHARDLRDLCRPLQHLNISYFTHVHVDNNSQFSALTNNPGFSEHYLRNQYYNADIHLAQTDQLGHYVIWDAIELDGQSEKMDRESAAFGVKHTFTIIEKNIHGSNYYHFASDLSDKSINQVYITNIDLLKIFISHFREKIRESKKLSHAYEIKFSIDNKIAAYTIKNDSEISLQDEAKQSFMKGIKNNQILILNGLKPLSFREIQVLSQLHKGNTLNHIAVILGITEITVKKHIANIKEKTGCSTQFQLGEYFSHKITRLSNF